MRRLSGQLASILRAIAGAVALCVAAQPVVAESPVIPAPRFTTQELVRWNAAERVVAAEQRAEIDVLLDEHRATVRREAIDSSLAVMPLGPGHAPRLPRTETPQEIERVGRQLLGRLETQRAREVEFGHRLVALLGPESAPAVERLLAGHELAAARRARQMSPTYFPDPRVPDLEDLARTVRLNDDVRAVAAHTIAAALPRLRPLARRVSAAVVQREAGDLSGLGIRSTSPEPNRDHWFAQQRVGTEAALELSRELAKLRHVQQLEELRLRRAVERADDGRLAALWWIGYGSVRPKPVNPFELIAAAHLSAVDAAIARAVVAEHTQPIRDALRACTAARALRLSIQSAATVLMRSVQSRRRAVPEDAPALHSFLNAERAGVPALVAEVAPVMLAAERSWDAALAALRGDWTAALDADSAARIEAAFRRGAFPNLVLREPRVSEAIRTAVASIDGDELGEAGASATAMTALDRLAARYDTDVDDLMAATIAAVEAVPPSEQDFMGGLGGGHRLTPTAPARRGGIVEEYRLQHRELASRAVRDAVSMLGDARLARAPRLRWFYEQEPFD